MRALKSIIAAFSIATLLNACGDGGDNEPKLPGNRIAIMQSELLLEADESLEDTTLNVGEPSATAHWAQNNASTSNITDAIAFPINTAGELSSTSTTIGDGEEWNSAVAPAPVSDGHTLFAMDAMGIISAHSLKGLNSVWENEFFAPDEETTLLGGGLALAEGALFAVTGMGHIAAFNADNGTKLWDIMLNIPVRSPPRVAGSQLLILTIDNRLFSINTKSGVTGWVHQGIASDSGYVSNATVAVSEDGNTLIVPHSSGDIFALQARSGRPIWNDNIGKIQRTRASSLFGGIHASPVIAGNIAYAIASDGLMVAARVQDGRILWQRELSSLHTPALAGDTAFVLATNGQLVALHRFDGRVRWASDVISLIEDGEEDETLREGWHAPRVVNDEIWLVHQSGLWLRIDAATGTLRAEDTLASDIAAAPIFVGNRMITIHQDASVTVYVGE